MNDKLTKASDVLRWACGVQLKLPWGRADDCDTATAERLAYCERVTAIVEREASKGNTPGYTVGMIANGILAEANEVGDE